MICEYCGFDSLEESIYMIGAPCGYKNCNIFTCCIKAWEKHMREYHNIDVNKEVIE